MKIRKLLGPLTAALASLGLLVGLALTANAAPARAHLLPLPFPPVGSCIYYTYTDGWSAAVVTSGDANCSETSAFKIDAPPYNGKYFLPSINPGPVSAFSHYLQQIGQWVYGPGSDAYQPPSAFKVVAPPVGVLTDIAQISNVYTNGKPVTVYRAAGDVHDHAAEKLVSLLTTGTP